MFLKTHSFDGKKGQEMKTQNKLQNFPNCLFFRNYIQYTI